MPFFAATPKVPLFGSVFRLWSVWWGRVGCLMVYVPRGGAAPARRHYIIRAYLVMYDLRQMTVTLCQPSLFL